ncbi:MAG: hypothetical protein QF442_01860 [Candidatus Peribacteraceae bacterium]|nr:hypothetical protein [Candidatus Peribacteraceae bacterium]
MTYYDLLPYVFKKFSLLRILRTGIPSAMHYVSRTPLPKSEKPAIFTMNIMPPMMTVWYHLVQKNLGDRVDLTIFDCSGTLKKSDFPKARVQKYINVYAATKSDEFLYHIARNRKIGWVCDDDMFILSDKCLERINQEFADPNTASLSFRPRDWWHFDIDGKEYEPSSSYSIVINREIYCDKENLNLSPCNGNNNAVSHIGKEVKRYDTFDHANEQLIRKGYNCAIVPEDQRNQMVTGFSGVSSAVMLLWYFRSSKKMMEYLEEPADEAWRGNTLFTVLSGLRAINYMQQMHEEITGKPYALRSMPSWDTLEALREKKTPLIRKKQSFERVDEVAAILKNSL